MQSHPPLGGGFAARPWIHGQVTVHDDHCLQWNDVHLQGTINGHYYWLNYGYPDAGDALNNGQIDDLVNYSGFTASIVGNPSTRFVRSDAPVPANCSVEYFDAYYTPPALVSKSSRTSILLIFLLLQEKNGDQTGCVTQSLWLL